MFQARKTNFAASHSWFETNKSNRLAPSHFAQHPASKVASLKPPAVLKCAAQTFRTHSNLISKLLFPSVRVRPVGAFLVTFREERQHNRPAMARRQEATEYAAVCGRARWMLMMQTCATGRSGESLRLVFLEVARVSVVWRRKSKRAARDAAGGGQAGGGGKRAAALTFCFSLSLLRPGDLGSLRVAHPAASALFSSLCAQTITRHFINVVFLPKPNQPKGEEAKRVRPGYFHYIYKIDPGGFSALVISQAAAAACLSLSLSPRAFFGLLRKRMCCWHFTCRKRAHVCESLVCALYRTLCSSVVPS